MGMVRPLGARSGAAGESREAGQALVVVLTVVLLLGVALALVAALLISRMQRAQDETRRVTLNALADAAMAETLANLAAYPRYGGVPERPFGGGTIESSVASGSGGFVIHAEARFEGAELAVEARGRLGDLGPLVTAWRRLPPSEPDAGGGSFEPVP